MTSKTIGTAILWLQSYPALGLRSEAGLLSEPAATIAPVKKVAPSAPEILSATGISESPGQVRLRLRLPTTNTDGSPCSIAELIRIRVHYNTHPNITESDPYNDFPVSETLEFAPNMLDNVYFRVKVMDSHGHWSPLSNEKSCSATRAARPFWAHRVGINSIFTNNSPSAGYVSWSNVTLFFKDQEYAIQNGSTNKRYIYWFANNPTVFQASDTVPALTVNDVLIGANVDGTWYLAVYHPQVSADFIRVGKLQSRNWGTTSGSQLDLDSGTFALGGSASPKLSWDGSTLRVLGTIQAGSNISGSNVISLDASGINVGSAGSIRGGKQSYGSSTAGFYLGYSDNAYKLDVGSTSQYVRWDGGSLRVAGTISVLPGSYLGSSSAVTIDASGISVGSTGSIRGGKTGYGSGTGFYLGYSGGAYKLDVGSSDQYLRWDGTNLSVKGTITVMSGSSGVMTLLSGSALGGSNVIAIDGSGISVGSTGSIRGGKSDYGVGTGFFLGYSGGAYKFDVGSSTQFLRWDGTSLTVAGTMSIFPGSYLGSGTAVTIDSSGINVGTTGSIRGGKSDYGVGTGFFLGYSGGAYKLDVGSSTQFVRWDGSSLTVAGTMSVFPGSYLGSGTAVTIDNSGINVGTTGSIRGGKTDYGSGTGFFLGYSGGTYKLDIGSSSSYVRWDGSTLTVEGKLKASSGSSIDGRYIYGTMTGVLAYGRSSQPYSYFGTEVVRAVQSSSVFSSLEPSSLYCQAGANDWVSLNPIELKFNTATTPKIRSTGHLLITAYQELEISAPNQYIRLSAPDIYLGGSAYDRIHFRGDWMWDSAVYTGGFWAPAKGIYIWQGGQRYAIPLYGPV